MGYNILYKVNDCPSPVGKNAEKAVCGSVFLTIWHCKTHSFRLFFWWFWEILGVDILDHFRQSRGNKRAL